MSRKELEEDMTVHMINVCVWGGGSEEEGEKGRKYAGVEYG